MAKVNRKRPSGPNINQEIPKLEEKPVDKVNTESDEMKVSNRPKIQPAKETPPDQEVLNKPIPKMGMGLLASWKSPKKR